jgi:hypothetical protein
MSTNRVLTVFRKFAKLGQLTKEKALFPDSYLIENRAFEVVAGVAGLPVQPLPSQPGRFDPDCLHQ